MYVCMFYRESFLTIFRLLILFNYKSLLLDLSLYLNLSEQEGEKAFSQTNLLQFLNQRRLSLEIL